VTDNITLPRAVAFEMLEALTCGSSIRHKCQHCGQHIGNFYAALYAALAAPEPEPTVKESLTVDAALAEPDDAEALRRENERLREALKLALNSHGRMLMSDPPQDPWKVNRVDEVIRELLQEVPR
jgi:hypothetical protein